MLLRAVNEVDLPTYSPPLSSSTNYIAGYKGFKDMRTAISIMKSTDRSLQEIDFETLSLKLYEKPYSVPKFEVVVDTTLFTCLGFGFKVPDDHDIYMHYRRSLTNITIQNLFLELEEYAICDGVDAGSENAIIHHVIPCETNPEHFDASPVQVKHYRRLPDCHVLVASKQICVRCDTFIKKEHQKVQKKEKKSKIPAKTNAPITKTDPLRLKQTLKLQRPEIIAT